MNSIANRSAQQDIQMPPEIAQQISVLNARVTNVNLANSDLLKDVDAILRTMASIIATLQKENADLKTKLSETHLNSKS